MAGPSRRQSAGEQDRKDRGRPRRQLEEAAPRVVGRMCRPGGVNLDERVAPKEIQELARSRDQNSRLIRGPAPSRTSVIRASAVGRQYGLGSRSPCGRSGSGGPVPTRQKAAQVPGREPRGDEKSHDVTRDSPKSNEARSKPDPRKQPRRPKLKSAPKHHERRRRDRRTRATAAALAQPGSRPVSKRGWTASHTREQATAAVHA